LLFNHHHNANNKCILIVDDEYDILNLLKQWLQLDGFNVCTFADPLMALEHFNSNFKHYSVVISDIMMPGINGYEFVRKVKRSSHQVKIILMSSLEMEQDSELSTVLPDLDVWGFIQKPFSLDMLRNTMVQCCSTKIAR
jgi:two-component system, cell cycle response regulator CpdR